MNNFYVQLALIIVLTLAFPPLLVASFVLIWSAFTSGDYIWGTAFFDFMSGIGSGYAGIILFTQLRRITAALNAALNHRR